MTKVHGWQTFIVANVCIYIFDKSIVAVATFNVLGFGASYIRDLTVINSTRPSVNMAMTSGLLLWYNTVYRVLARNNGSKYRHIRVWAKDHLFGKYGCTFRKHCHIHWTTGSMLILKISILQNLSYMFDITFTYLCNYRFAERHVPVRRVAGY